MRRAALSKRAVIVETCRSERPLLFSLLVLFQLGCIAGNEPPRRNHLPLNGDRHFRAVCSKLFVYKLV